MSLLYIDSPTVPRPLIKTVIKLNSQDMKFRINHLMFAGVLAGFPSSVNHRPAHPS